VSHRAVVRDINRICGRQTWRSNKIVSRDRSGCCAHLQLGFTGDSTVLNVR